MPVTTLECQNDTIGAESKCLSMSLEYATVHRTTLEAPTRIELAEFETLLELDLVSPKGAVDLVSLAIYG